MAYIWDVRNNICTYLRLGEIEQIMHTKHMTKQYMIAGITKKINLGSV